MQEDIRLENICVSYGSKKVLENISFTVRKGETVALIGPSGCGKSTILRLIIGLQKQSAGQLYIAGKNIDSYGETELSVLRKTMGMVFQYSALFDFLNVQENIAFGLRQHTTLSDEAIALQVKELEKLVDLVGKGDLMPGELSGGMKKRVSLARAVAIHPQILLYDEPTAGLDPIVSRTINKLMAKVQKEFKTTSIVVTHDMESALMVADRVILLYGGSVVVDKSVREIFDVQNDILQNFIVGWDEQRMNKAREVLADELNQ